MSFLGVGSSKKDAEALRLESLYAEFARLKLEKAAMACDFEPARARSETPSAAETGPQTEVRSLSVSPALSATLHGRRAGRGNRTRRVKGYSGDGGGGTTAPVEAHRAVANQHEYHYSVDSIGAPSRRRRGDIFHGRAGAGTTGGVAQQQVDSVGAWIQSESRAMEHALYSRQVQLREETEAAVATAAAATAATATAAAALLPSKQQQYEGAEEAVVPTGVDTTAGRGASAHIDKCHDSTGAIDPATAAVAALLRSLGLGKYVSTLLRHAMVVDMLHGSSSSRGQPSNALSSPSGSASYAEVLNPAATRGQVRFELLTKAQ